MTTKLVITVAKKKLTVLCDYHLSSTFRELNSDEDDSDESNHGNFKRIKQLGEKIR